MKIVYFDIFTIFLQKILFVIAVFALLYIVETLFSKNVSENSCK